MARLSPPRRLAGWLQAAHPFPIAMVLSLTALVGFASSDGEPDAARLATVLLAMLLSQLAIGWANDYLDRERDRRFQPSKPVPSGLVEARYLPPAVVVATAGSLVAGAFLGPVPLLLLVTGTAAGLAYDLHVKDTPLSWLPYVVAFAVLPPFVWSALDVYHDDFAALYLVGAPLAVAAHLANVLPDVETDAAAGRAGLAVRLGRRRALELLGACLIAPLVLLALTLPWLDYDAALLLPAVATYAFLTLCAAVAYARRPRRQGAVIGFRLVVLAGVVFATGWLAAV